jgi:SAM-dependent methyltransferase
MCAQFCGYAAGTMLVSAGVHAPGVAAAGHAAAALSIAALLRLPAPWLWVNALIPFGVFALNGAQVPSWAIGVPLAIALLLYIPTFWTRVPYYPTSEPMYEAVLAELPKGKAVRFLDLGSGSGKLLLWLAARRGECTFEGAEISPLAWILSSARVIFSRRANVRISYRSFWKMDFGAYDAVYAFLAPPPMAELWNKVKSELKPGAIFLVNSFEVPGVKPEKSVEVDDKKRSLLFVYRI